MKTVLITGASSGIGEACALWLQDRGYRVFAGVRKNTDAETLKQKSKGHLRPVLLDVTDETSIREAAQLVFSQAPQLDGLVNNAGIAVAGPLEFLPLPELRRVLEVNVVGQVAVTQAFLPLLRKARGRVVLMSSISGRVAAPLMGPYAASKFALEAIGDALRRELGPWGIEVSIIEPGNIQTPIWGKGVAWGEALKQQLPPEAIRLYGRAIDGILNYIRAQDGSGLHPNEVARVVAQALASARPRTRYVVGRDARAGALLARLLPDRWVDRFIAGRRLGQR
ncbi:SDR family oxidoreductase [Meiothermus sp.]|uniref:SDR family oxidoreductase n=1 Tax=Meiothermus sp. TaxID=1955249 RepID=UPI0021DB9D08|nr:SDR family oxidoreductase [Meiothermus sp.]GIW35755.1 MAG: short-chain dehydrogenase/reductase [Meiothermus sp.]